MKKLYIVLLITLGMLVGTSLAPTETSARPKHKISKGHKKHYKIKKLRNGKKQSVQESLNLLQNYLPEYYNITLLADAPEVTNFNLGSNYDQNSIFTDPILRKTLVENINDWLGTRYRHGGHSKAGVDCSNFTACIVESTLGIKFPGSPQGQLALFEPINNIDDMQFGDLIFFTGRNQRAKRVGHVGFYLGDGLFAHSSSGRGVIYTHINQGYYAERFRYGGRFIKSSWAGILTSEIKTN